MNSNNRLTIGLLSSLVGTQMPRFGALCVILPLVFLQTSCAQPSVVSLPKVQSSQEYRLGPGDEIGIQVFGEKDLSLPVAVNSDGTISYPFLGQLRAQGLTTKELEGLVAEGLRGDYLVNPKVTVTVVSYRPFFINGEVQKPGAYAYQPRLTVHRAISIAGGFTDRAARSKIFVIREGDPEAAPVRLTLEDAVGPGDIIIVRESFF